MRIHLDGLSEDECTATEQAQQLTLAAMSFRADWSRMKGAGPRDGVVYSFSRPAPLSRALVYQTKGGTIVAKVLR